MKGFIKKTTALYIALGLIIFTSGLYFFPGKAEASCGSGYAFCRTITVDHTQAGASDSSNFTILASTTLVSLKTVANGGDVNNTVSFNSQTVPADVVFSTTADCGTLMSWDFDHYVSTTGEIEAWVKLSTLSHTADTTFYMCYGNLSVSTYQGGSVGAAWDGNYLNVYHAEDNAANSNVIDSTSAGNTGTALKSLPGTAVNTSGMSTPAQIANGLAYNQDSRQAIQLPNTINVGVNGAFTTSAWFKGTNTDMAVFALRDNLDSGNAVWDMVVGFNGADNTGTGKPSFIWRDGGGTGLEFFSGSTAVNDGNWHYMVATRDSSQHETLYVDGNSVGSAGPDGGFNTTTFHGGQDANIGNDALNSAIQTNGVTIDEPRISSTNRTADWITAEYNNQKLGSTMVTFGAHQISTKPALIGHSSCSGNACTTGAIDNTGATLLVVMQSCFNAPCTAPTDSSGNTWHSLTSQQDSGGYESIWYAWNPTVTTSQTFTGCSIDYGMEVMSFSGIQTSSDPLDKQNGAGGTGSTIATGSITPSDNGYLVISYVGGDLGDSLSTYTIDSSMVKVDQLGYSGGVAYGQANAYYIQPTAGAINPTWTSSNNDFLAGATVASFIVGSGGGIFGSFIPHVAVRGGGSGGGVIKIHGGSGTGKVIFR